MGAHGYVVLHRDGRRRAGRIRLDRPGIPAASPLLGQFTGLAEALPYRHSRQLRELEQCADAQPMKLLQGESRQWQQGDG